MSGHLEVGTLSDNEILDQMGDELESDRRFFRRRPYRHHRLRRVFPAEMEHLRRHSEGKTKSAIVKIPADKRLYASIRRQGQEVFLLKLAAGPADAELDLTEEEARAFYELVDGGLQ